LKWVRIAFTVVIRENLEISASEKEKRGEEKAQPSVFPHLLQPQNAGKGKKKKEKGGEKRGGRKGKVGKKTLQGFSPFRLYISAQELGKKGEKRGKKKGKGRGRKKKEREKGRSIKAIANLHVLNSTPHRKKSKREEGEGKKQSSIRMNRPGKPPHSSPDPFSAQKGGGGKKKKRRGWGGERDGRRKNRLKSSISLI